MNRQAVHPEERALGARTSDVLLMVLRGGLVLAAVGVVVGLIGALGFSSLLEHQLYRVDATDPATYVGLSILLTFVALLSSLIPALRAARVSPVRALREE